MRKKSTYSGHVIRIPSSNSWVLLQIKKQFPLQNSESAIYDHRNKSCQFLSFLKMNPIQLQWRINGRQFNRSFWSEKLLHRGQKSIIYDQILNNNFTGLLKMKSRPCLNQKNFIFLKLSLRNINLSVYLIKNEV